VFATLGAISREVGFCLLVAWSPWLALVTFAASLGSELLLTDGTGRKKLIDALKGYVALSAGVTLWLMRARAARFCRLPVAPHVRCGFTESEGASAGTRRCSRGSQATEPWVRRELDGC
jgi:hypothetical protein